MLPRNQKFAALLLSLGGVSLAVGLYTLDASTGYNLNDLPLEREIGISVWLPEGWAFFTRDPREEAVRVYVRSRDGEWANAIEAPLGAWSNALGLNRKPRRQNVEQGLLLATLPQEGWTSCVSTELALCLDRVDPTVTFTNPSPVGTLCGEIAVVRQKPVPFAWITGKGRDELQDFRVPNRFIRVEAKC